MSVRVRWRPQTPRSAVIWPPRQLSRKRLTRRQSVKSAALGPSLLTLPPEILMMIVSYNSCTASYHMGKVDHNARRDLVSLLRTCKTLFDICVPHVWAVVSEFPDQRTFDRFCDSLATSPRAPIYARAILILDAFVPHDSLEHLTSKQIGVSSNEIRKLARVDGSWAPGPKFPRLIILSLGPSTTTWKPITDASICALVKQCPRLINLGLDRLDEVKGNFIIRMEQQLSHLTLRNCMNTAGTVSRIIGRHAPTLEHVDMTDIYPRHLQAISECCNLQKLYLEDLHVDEKETIAFRSLIGTIPKLEEFCLVGARNLDSDCMKAIIEGIGASLRVLCLGAVGRVGDHAIQALADKCPNLEHLDLGDLVVTDAPLIEIAKKCPKLKYLDITYNDLVTDDLLDALAVHCKNLQAFYAAEAYHLGLYSWTQFLSVQVPRGLASFSAGALWHARWEGWVFYKHVKQKYPQFTAYDAGEREFSLTTYAKLIAPAIRFDPIPLPARPAGVDADPDFWAQNIA
ncbi:hypothetical protein HDU85_006418 [Gaertneriomyces sp. JEL0708]|nr:hypothetical protein HDU85_006418 [Gaertneriomyces sp. JEL0708]